MQDEHMKIVLGGQLDRVFANEVGIAAGLDPDEAPDSGEINEQRLSDRRYFHLAGTVAALSDRVVTLPYVRWINDENSFATSAVNTAASETILEHARSYVYFDRITEEAVDLVNVCALIGRFAISTSAVLDEIDTELAWLGDYHALMHLHADRGAPIAYIVGLLVQALLAWESDAVFVLAECDRSILADLGSILVRNRWPRPFPIPDLRNMGPPPDEKRRGRLLNLQPTDFPAVAALGRELRVRAYADAVFDVIRNARAGTVGPALERAERPAHSTMTAHGASEFAIELVAGSVEMFSNVGTVNPSEEPDSDDWSKRRFPSRRLATIVLS
jgi:hypothetical protein